MLLKSILNHVEKNKRFVYGTARWAGDGKRIEVPIQPRKNSLPICSTCNAPGPVYDHLGLRVFDYVPLWGIPVFFLYVMRRVKCRRCGVKVEEVPWAVGKSPLTRTFSLFLAMWAKRLSWLEVGVCFGTTWNQVRDAVRWVVEYGLAHRDLSDVRAIGVDEMQIGHGQTYVTLVYQIDRGMRRLLNVARDRTEDSLRGFLETRGDAWCRKIQFVCSDMWKPYLNVIREKCKKALNVLDRYHLVANLNKRLDEVRRAEAKRLAGAGFHGVLDKVRYCFLKRPANLTPSQKTRLDEVLAQDLKSGRAYMLKESFQMLWAYETVRWATWFLRKWCARAMRSRLAPIKRFARSIRKHEDLILNWFRARKEYSSGVVEGLNRKANLITRRSYGLREYDTLELVLYHTLGHLPLPAHIHRFW
jgi:transposase